MTPADRDIAARAARTNPPSEWEEFVIEQADWDEGHSATVLDWVKQGMTDEQALAQVKEDLDDERSKRQWREAHADELAELDVRTNGALNRAYEVYAGHYIYRSEMRLARRNPAGFKVGDRVRYTGKTNRELANGAFGKATRVSPKEREFTFLADGGSIWNSDGEEIRVSYDDAVHEAALPRASSVGRRPYRQKNPDDSPDQDERDQAADLYERFHRYPPIKIGEFARGFAIPARMLRVGPALWTTYRSAKVDPATLKKPRKPVNYIHEHDAGVEVYVTLEEGAENGWSGTDSPYDDVTEGVEVPKEFRRAKALVKLGEGLGYKFKLGDDEIEAEADAPLPELYATPDGKCLLVIQDKCDVLAMIWGGALGVFPRGIDG